MDIQVLYEDNHIIAVVKPAGVLSQGDMTGKPSIYDMVKDYIRVKKGKMAQLGNAHPVRNSEGSSHTSSLRDRQRKVSNGVFLGLVHRLDKPVAGIMLFAKTSKGAARLSEQFRNHTIQKTYHAIVVGKLKESQGTLKEKVNKISFFAEGFTNKSDKEILEAVKKATKTRTAELSYELTKSHGEYSLLKIVPKTGRFHQIRVQMSELGHPILGDITYGGKNPDWKDQNSIALCATGISFKTATGDKIIDLKIELPAEWQSFLNPESSR